MVSIPQLAHLAALIKEKNARLVTLGDSDQNHSVERGDAIRILQESGSVRSVQLTETYRAQVQYLKDTVLDLKAGRRQEGYRRLEEHGDIREIQDLDELRQQAVDAHLDAVRAGHLAILASPIHAEARAAAQIVRETLKAEGLIAKEDYKFTRLVRQRQPERLDPWLQRATTSAVDAIRRFATGLYEDYEAVKAGVTGPWNSGPVEGHINRLKMLKRQMFGRARLDLLSRRFLLAPRDRRARVPYSQERSDAHAPAAAA